jgi:hypothetical protein
VSHRGKGGRGKRGGVSEGGEREGVGIERGYLSRKSKRDCVCKREREKNGRVVV